VYQLAIEFNIDRRTVSDRLKKAGVKVRLQPPPNAIIDDMVRLYESDLSCAIIGNELRMSPQTDSAALREGTWNSDTRRSRKGK
jgi:hypothetical protein